MLGNLNGLKLVKAIVDNIWDFKNQFQIEILHILIL